ncbi:SRPBCC domain-containing protein [Actinomadura sp. HBU206391]|uniref:SRPBCC family protein n=1 Tax=Actinomadura sp. HBU206391 TaxID=2731692 RepID=UPI00164F223F|nr:SRPBCC domain-containing protein [Actinomadura sp. HBU206391]MBC6463291.1 SRPBCC domain-containing protein [Actinomadura sp. HBU206391]
MTHPFELSQEIELAATPEEVWDAIATGPGVDSWFMGRTELGTSAGGPANLTMMGHTEQATITAYEPGTRLATRSAEAPDGRFMAFEYLIEGHGGGTTVLRLVQSGMLGDDWETEFEAMKAGWPIYLETLQQYLTYFTGRTPSVTTVFRPGAGGPDAVWKIVTESLGVTPDVAEGDAVRLPDGSAGVVYYANLPVNLGVRTDEGLYRFIHSGTDRGDALVLGHQNFAGRDQQAEWDAWMAEHLG